MKIYVIFMQLPFFGRAWYEGEQDFFNSVSYKGPGQVSTLVTPDFSGFVNRNHKVMLDSEMWWSDDSTAKKLNSNEIKELKRALPISRHFTLNSRRFTTIIEHIEINISKSVYNPKLMACPPKGECLVPSSTEVFYRWTVYCSMYKSESYWNALLAGFFPQGHFKNKNPLKFKFKPKDQGIWSLYFKPVNLIVNGTVTESIGKLSTPVPFTAIFPVSTGKELFGIFGQENHCITPHTTLENDLSPEYLDPLRKVYCENTTDYLVYNDH
ncbi:hypothetical protein DSO57_1016142 [Entomophthora muscae]|uniref:Uncharacterized protein n=1 Tax=Entomophthora muscae TaxID=34485 RepID=A0ACC2T504_9FUNG|nr:hypothetical protein DSO57_1016142 [Entomophthora muscae]